MRNEANAELRAHLASMPELIRRETEGLSFEQMAFATREYGWAWWSVELHVRHMAQIPCNWLYIRGEEVMRAAGHCDFPSSAEAIARTRRGGARLVPPEVAPTRAALLELMREWTDFSLAVFDAENPDGLRRIRIHSYIDPRKREWNDPNRTIVYTRLSAKLHPSGYTEDPDREGHFIVELGTAFEHIYWNILAHLRNIQRIKGLMELRPVLELPRVGYLTIPEYYN